MLIAEKLPMVINSVTRLFRLVSGMLNASRCLLLQSTKVFVARFFTVIFVMSMSGVLWINGEVEG